MGTTSSTTMQSLGKIEQRAPAVGKDAGLKKTRMMGLTDSVQSTSV